MHGSALKHYPGCTGRRRRRAAWRCGFCAKYCVNPTPALLHSNAQVCTETPAWFRRVQSGVTAPRPRCWSRWRLTSTLVFAKMHCPASTYEARRPRYWSCAQVNSSPLVSSNGTSWHSGFSPRRPTRRIGCFRRLLGLRAKMDGLHCAQYTHAPVRQRGPCRDRLRIRLSARWASRLAVLAIPCSQADASVLPWVDCQLLPWSAR
jgi:hypothetical protein